MLTGPSFAVYCNCKHIAQLIQESLSAKLSPKLTRFRVVKGLNEALREAKLRLSGVEETPACSEGECLFSEAKTRLFEAVAKAIFYLCSIHFLG
jgi:hypothetical protein